MSPDNGTDMTDLIKKLSAIKKEPVFRNSVYEVTVSSDDVIIATHTSNNQKAIGIFSVKGTISNVPADLPDGSYKDLISGKTIEVTRGRLVTNGEPIIIIY